MQQIKIKSIKKIPKRDRYDLTVNSTKNFFANNILIHNTSVVISKVMCKRKLNIFEKIAKLVGLKIIDTEFKNIYSSRKVIKNDPSFEHKGFYKEDIWGKANKKISDFLFNGMTAYCEIVGYTGDTAIQSLKGKAYDYGCALKEFGVYIYRLTYTTLDGKVFEFSAKQVQEFCQTAPLGVYSVCENYYGYAKDLIDDDDDDYRKFSEKLLESLNDKFIGGNCRFCNNKVPAEGIVVRVENTNPLFQVESFKLKSFEFYEAETKALDNGEIDIESE